MGTLIICWLLFPAAFLAVSWGWGALLERAGGLSLSPALLPALGFAAITVVSVAATTLDATAGLAFPLVAIVGAGSFAWSAVKRRLAIDRWALVAALAVFLVYGAPVILSGEATFAGYTKLDDTSTWLALTDRMIEHGRSLDGLAPSTYQRLLDFNLHGWYPVGAFPPLGVAGKLSGQDPAWVIQPYMSLLAGMLTLVLSAIASRVLESPRRAALAAAIAGQPALLVGYALWGGLKELAAVPLIALCAALAAEAAADRSLGRGLLPLAVSSAALISILTVGGAAWLAPLLVGALVIAIRQGWPLRSMLKAAAVAGVLIAAVGLPAVLGGGILPPTASELDNLALGTLLKPLNDLQVAGIWPVGDFRMTPDAIGLTYAAIAVALVAAAYALWWSWTRGAWPLFFYGLTGTIGLATILAFGSPWVDAKALAMASPAILLLAAVGALVLFGQGRRLEGSVALAVIAIGVGWSNVLAYHDVELAPRDQLAELETIAPRIAGEGPTLITEFQPYGARHFLRDADAEAVSELRARQIPVRDGRIVPTGHSADTDQLRFPDLRIYRTLVIRRSPAGSRPPADYRLVWSGDYYEVWQRAPGEPRPAQHLPLGQLAPAELAAAVARVGVPNCSRVGALARWAGPGGELIASPGAQPIVVPLGRGAHPGSWERDRDPDTLVPDGSGSATATFVIRRAGDYSLWLRGSVMGGLEAFVDGQRVGEVRHRIDELEQYIELGSTQLSAGPHRVELRFSGPDLHPGSGAPPASIGPLLVGTSSADAGALVRLPPARARELCGKPWDWVEARRP